MEILVSTDFISRWVLISLKPSISETAKGLCSSMIRLTKRNGLVAILTGKVGGPWGIISSLGNFQGPQFVPIEMNLDGANSSAKVGSAVELQMEPIKNPVSGADAFPGLVLPQGLLYGTSTRASSKSFKVRANVEFEFSGKDAAFSPFEWSGP